MGETKGKNFFEECNEKGKKLAKILGVKFIEGKPEHSLKPIRNERGELVMNYKPYKSKTNLLILISAIIVLLGFIFLQ